VIIEVRRPALARVLLVLPQELFGVEAIAIIRRNVDVVVVPIDLQLRMALQECVEVRLIVRELFRLH
jgi:hypothetical protein